MQKLLALFLAGFLFFACGCVIPGSPNQPVEDNSVTLQAQVTAPEAWSSALPASVKFSSAQVLELLAEKGVCKINGVAAEFSLNTTTSELKIEKLPPAEAYEISLQAGAVHLQQVVLNTGRLIKCNLSLRTTVEYLLRRAYARDAAISAGSFADYQVNAPLATDLESKLRGELVKSSAAAETVAAFISTHVESIAAQKSFSEVFARQGGAYLFAGKWQGKVSYFLHDAQGAQVMIVQADASAQISRSGNTAAGSFSLKPLGVIPLQKSAAGLSAPSEISFAFTGPCDGHTIRFTRQGTLGPLTGKNIDTWELFPISRGLACRAVNVDSAYNTGIRALPGDFVLSREQSQ